LLAIDFLEPVPVGTDWRVLIPNAGKTVREQGEPLTVIWSFNSQIVMISDVNRIQPRAYDVHRHKVNRKPPGWTTQGPSKVRKIMEMITPMVKIYQQKPHSTWDNFFSGERICSWLGENVFGCNHDLSPKDLLTKDILGENFHKKKTSSVLRPKVARFHHLICAMKSVMPEGDN
jgi:hypothetical protein